MLRKHINSIIDIRVGLKFKRKVWIGDLRLGVVNTTVIFKAMRGNENPGLCIARGAKSSQVWVLQPTHQELEQKTPLSRVLTGPLPSNAQLEPLFPLVWLFAELQFSYLNKTFNPFIVNLTNAFHAYPPKYWYIRKGSLNCTAKANAEIAKTRTLVYLGGRDHQALAFKDRLTCTRAEEAVGPEVDDVMASSHHCMVIGWGMRGSASWWLVPKRAKGPLYPIGLITLINLAPNQAPLKGGGEDKRAAHLFSLDSNPEIIRWLLQDLKQIKFERAERAALNSWLC